MSYFLISDEATPRVDRFADSDFRIDFSKMLAKKDSDKECVDSSDEYIGHDGELAIYRW